MTQIYEAAQFADLCHRGQFRKYTKRPYISHPAKCVGRLMLVPDITDDDISIMWLHDTIEDCGVTHEQLLTKFNRVVADGVVELTNPSKSFPRLKRHERKLMDLEHAHGMSKRGKQKKMIDRIDNLYDIGSFDPSFAKLYLSESGRLLKALEDADSILAGEFAEAMNFVSRSLRDG